MKTFCFILSFISALSLKGQDISELTRRNGFKDIKLGSLVDSVSGATFEKDIIERSFRTMKGDVLLHPIRLWLPTRVNAHIKICYLSLCLLSLIKYRCRNINIAPTDILNELLTAYKVNLKHTKTKQTFSKVVTLSNNQKNILKALKCSV